RKFSFFTLPRPSFRMTAGGAAASSAQHCVYRQGWTQLSLSGRDWFEDPAAHTSPVTPEKHILRWRSGFRLRTPALPPSGIAHARKTSQVVKDRYNKPLASRGGGWSRLVWEKPRVQRSSSRIS